MTSTHIFVPIKLNPGSAIQVGTHCPCAGTWLHVAIPVVRRQFAAGEMFPDLGVKEARWMLLNLAP